MTALSCAALFFSGVLLPVEPTYKNVFEKIIQPKCVGCHDRSGLGGLDLSDFASLMAFPGMVTAGSPEKSLLWDSVNSGRMPLGYKLESWEIHLLREWILQGGKETP